MTTSIPQEDTKSVSSKAARKTRVAKRPANAVPFRSTSARSKSARRSAADKKPAIARSGSKTAKILQLLKRPRGVTLKELMKVSGWQPHSVRGFLSGTIGKKMGIPAESSKRADGERVYSVSSK